MYKKPVIQTLNEPAFANAGVEVDCLRLDEIHPVVSGNKYFKLKHFIKEARRQSKRGLVSFGGPYSNHLVALAFACAEEQLECVGIIRGEEPTRPAPSLRYMRESGMRLIFLDRPSYRHGYVPAGLEHLLTVPEGGAGTLGVAGAVEILANTPNQYSHIVCAVGTGTTLAGLVNASYTHQRLTGICCLKVQDPNDNELERYLRQYASRGNWSMAYDYHFGGYAKKTDELIAFMNGLHKMHSIPTDFVYTGKLFYAVYDLLARNHFPKGARILIIHSGGLQGNRSLPPGLLHYNS